ncbi:MAG: hypothetical protein LBF37_00985 [Rickettsiales bacterium]|nr:hypothetical protein [Rickettsiales bacterium]
MSEQTGEWGFYAEAGARAMAAAAEKSSYETIMRNARSMSAADFRKYFKEVRGILGDEPANCIVAFDRLEKEDKESSAKDGTSNFHKNVAVLADYVHKLNLTKNPAMADRAMSDKYKFGQVRVERKAQNNMLLNKQLTDKEHS